MRVAIVLVTLVYAGFACGKLPPRSDEDKAKAAQAAAKAAWTDKVSLYKTCLAMDRVAEVSVETSRKQASKSPLLLQRRHAPTLVPMLLPPRR